MKGPIYYYIFNSLLISLLVLHIYWWVLMFRMLVKQIQNGGRVGDDVRSGIFYSILYSRLFHYIGWVITGWLLICFAFWSRFWRWGTWGLRWSDLRVLCYRLKYVSKTVEDSITTSNVVIGDLLSKEFISSDSHRYAKLISFVILIWWKFYLLFVWDHHSIVLVYFCICIFIQNQKQN